MRVISTTIEAGETQTESIPQNEQALVGVTAGSNITAENIGFLVSLDGNNFSPLYDELFSSSVEVLCDTSASYIRAFVFDPLVMYPWTHIKIREGTSASAVAQSASDGAATFKLSFRNKQE
jgi:hypothetical protein